MTRTIKIAPVKKTITLQTSPEGAFDIFTAELDRWWPKSHGIGATPIRTSIIEPFVGGRWYSIFEDGAQAVVGHVRLWEPAQRLIVSWEINTAWKPDSRQEFASEVEVRFIREGTATRVELEHRDFAKMGESEGQVMHDGVERGWPGLLELFAAAALKK